MTDERLREIIRVVNRVVDRYVYTLPVDIEALCHTFGARMTTIDDAVALGLDEDTVLKCIGNKDGVANEGRKVWGIIYNKNAPVNRLRFTLSEELMHHLLGHTKDPRFNAISPSYDHATYMKYEEEAKAAAGMLLVSPLLYHRFSRTLTKAGMAEMFGVSLPCLYVVSQLYEGQQRSVIDEAFTRKTLFLEDARPRRAAGIRRPVLVRTENGML